MEHHSITVTPIKVEVPDSVEPSVSSSSSSTNDRQRTTHHKVATQRRKPPTIETFWPTVLEEVRSIQQVDAKHQALPLARIKKIMKLDENTRMIAAEAPLLFAKACEYFIQELTLRAWVHTEESKRRTLQRSDIAQAISICDQFDFLIDIVPREEIKPPTTSVKKEADKQVNQQQSTAATSSVSMNSTTNTVQTPTAQPEQQPMQYYIQLGGGQQAHLQQPHIQTSNITSNGLLGNQQIQQSLQGINIVTAPQNILLTAGNPGQQQTAATMVNSLQNPQQQIQLIQQVVTPNGEITNVPITITANQLNLLRMQMQGNQAANALQTQQVLIPTIPTQQQTQLVHIGGGNVATAANVIQNPGHGNIFLSTGHGNSIVSTDRNLGSTFRPNC
ncbi:nuclear transcription factor Y subunit gamma [Episyrphus balteatus]|uniref:nuclear transcription factor Y subunit gamma n=1 Tax=Episyrphus balteatus TaxID=286459 RepID=UPI0024858C13|nr:nuclear transcription factor Y subunit gamma [Episyrphus balteatus]XP_055844091.1 nuclear transcription factor Y subunit gamma [Episyrphus balteatus]